MPTSQHFKELSKRLTKLRRHFLPSSFSPIGSYTERVYDRVLGYRLLVHAEIEFYLETVALETIRQKVKAWKKSKAGSDVIVCFLACYHSGWEIDSQEKPRKESSKKKIKDSVEKIIDFAMIQYKYNIDNNHGIMTDNLKKILIPIGIRFEDLDSTWQTNIDNYGKKRGEAAHKSIGTQKPADPKTELSEVQGIVSGLKVLDKLILSLR